MHARITYRAVRAIGIHTLYFVRTVMCPFEHCERARTHTRQGGGGGEAIKKCFVPIFLERKVMERTVRITQIDFCITAVARSG